MSCGGGFANVNDALALWQSGYRGDAVDKATLEYDRFRDANGLDEARVQAWAEALRARIDEEPVVARGERPGALPAVRAIEGPGTLDRAIRADLLSLEASRVARALGVVAGLSLTQHAGALIALIYDHRAVNADGDVLDDRTPAERTVTLKRMALSTLQGLR